MSELKMPIGGLQDPNGQFNRAGTTLLSKIVERVSAEPASDAEKLLAGGRGAVSADAVWEAMVPVPTTGSGDFRPDMTKTVDFVRTLSGPSTVLFPELGMDDALPYFSILAKQDSIGGWSLDWGAGFQGEPPVILTAANDQTLVGGKVLTRNPDTFTAWAVKGMQA